LQAACKVQDLAEFHFRIGLKDILAPALKACKTHLTSHEIDEWQFKFQRRFPLWEIDVSIHGEDLDEFAAMDNPVLDWIEIALGDLMPKDLIKPL
jgi:hypothetical protein